MLGQANNQALAIGLAQERKHAHITFKRTSTRSEVSSCSCSWSIKKDYNWGYDCITRLSKGKTCDWTTLGNNAGVSHNAT